MTNLKLDRAIYNHNHHLNLCRFRHTATAANACSYAGEDYRELIRVAAAEAGAR